MKLLCTALMLSLPALAAQAEPSAPAGPVPPFHVTVQLSKTATESLATIKETVIVAAYYYGLPAPGQENRADEGGQIPLGLEKVELPGAGTAAFTGVGFKSERLPYIQGTVRVLVNVLSGGKSSSNNLLDCGFFDGTVAEAAKKELKLSCQMIAELRKPGSP